MNNNLIHLALMKLKRAGFDIDESLCTIYKGDIGESLLKWELLVRAGIRAEIVTEKFGFDLITAYRRTIQVKLANLSEGRNGRGQRYKTYGFRLNPSDKDVSDVLVLIFNTEHDILFYVIPMNEVKGQTIRFNPFSSRGRSRFRGYRDCWEFIFPLKMCQEKAETEIRFLNRALSKTRQIKELESNLIPITTGE